MATELVSISDEELQQLAQEGGPLSLEAYIIKELSRRRAKDHQAYAFRIGDSYYTGPIPDAQTESVLIGFLEQDETVVFLAGCEPPARN